MSSGLYCNHYFLQTLAQIGRGYYDAAYDLGALNSTIMHLSISVYYDASTCIWKASIFCPSFNNLLVQIL